MLIHVLSSVSLILLLGSPLSKKQFILKECRNYSVYTIQYNKDINIVISCTCFNLSMLMINHESSILHLLQFGCIIE